MGKQVKPVQTGRPLPTQTPWNGKGKVLLQAGTRGSTPDQKIQGTLKPNQHTGPHTAGDNNDDIDRIMYLLNLNLQHRIKTRGSKSNRDKLKGLFGGGK